LKIKDCILIGDINIFSKDRIGVKEFNSYCPSNPSQIEGTYIITEKDEKLLFKNLKYSDFKIH